MEPVGRLDTHDHLDTHGQAHNSLVNLCEVNSTCYLPPKGRLASSLQSFPFSLLIKRRFSKDT